MGYGQERLKCHGFRVKVSFLANKELNSFNDMRNISGKGLSKDLR